MDAKIKKATAHVECGGKFGTAFLISPVLAITAYHVVSRYVEGSSIFLEFSLPGETGNRSAKLLNSRNEIDTGIDLAILQLDKPLEEIEPLQLTAKELPYDLPWKAFGFPATKDTPGQTFVGEVSMFVEQHISKYDLDLDCRKPDITDPKYVVFGASGSAVIVDKEVVAVLSDKMPGGTLGAVSIKFARELLTELNITFTDNTSLVAESPSNELEEMLKMYHIKVRFYLENSMTLPFPSELNNDLIKYSYFSEFFEISTWKSKIIDHINTISKEFNSNAFLRESIIKLQELYELDLPYEEFQSSMRKTVDLILEEIPDDKRTKGFRQLLFHLYNLLKRRYNKVLVLTGESGSGKTHLLKTILSSYQSEKGLEYYSIRIPISINEIKDKGFGEAIKFSLNHFLNSNFNDISDVNHFVNNLKKVGITFKVIFIIDDLQNLCNSSAKHYDDIKQTIVMYTKFDWVSWCLSINEFDQYLIMDNSRFLEKYCFSNNFDDANLFVSMSKINSENKVCHRILNNYGIDTKVIEKFPQNITNIKMLLNNPLISYVYANTVNENEKELHNICYFNFIKRYSDIKKKQMVEYSERDLPFQEKDVQINNEINQVVNFVIKNKKLTYSESELNDLFKSLAHCYFELRSVHLVSKAIVEFEDDIESRKDIIVKFVFKLYWAYKILLEFRSRDNWSEFSLLRDSFVELKDDLLIYEILYLDTDFEKNSEILNQEITDVLNSTSEKGLLFFVGIKTSFNCQEIIFLELLEKGELILNKQETFGLMYFLLHTNARNAKIPQKCIVLSKYLNKVSEHELGGYLNGICKSIFGKLNNLTKFKRCMAEFICSSDTNISKMIGKIAAENFIRIVTEKQYSLEEIVKNHLIIFLGDNLEKIKESMNTGSEKGKNSNATFIEYFLRFLFRLLIENNEDNRLLLHEILLKENFYYLERVKADNKFKIIGHILRSNSAIAYGAYYKHLNHSKKKNFKKQYIECITKLLDSELIEQRILAFHFISNTLIDEDPKSTLDIDFFPLLKVIHEDNRLEMFNDGRKDFYERNFYPYLK
ncbi:serine protease [Domibacillus epiphyticus]|nr:serine protease [Domibacillus epiphyticus]